MMKRALITGITGQDGAYLAEHLLAKGYEVHGIKRRMSSFNTWRIDHLYQDRHLGETKLFLHYGDLTDSTNLIRIIKNVEPDEIYNLAAMSHVHVSFEQPEYVANADGIGTLRLLEAVRLLGMIDKTRIYQASTSELYGKVQDTPQSETTPFYPVSPYAVAKMYAYWITVNYREAYGLFASNGILFNHESPLRGETFVTRKITKAVGRISLDIQEKLTLGNLDASRDWGYAGDYVEGMWMMLQHGIADDWVLATGETYKVSDFVKSAFEYAGLEWSKYVETSEKYFRPNEVDFLLGDSSKAEKELKWKSKTSFDQLVQMMVDADIEEAKREDVLLKNNLLKPTWEHPAKKY